MLPAMDFLFGNALGVFIKHHFHFGIPPIVAFYLVWSLYQMQSKQLVVLINE